MQTDRLRTLLLKLDHELDMVRDLAAQLRGELVRIEGIEAVKAASATAPPPTNTRVHLVTTD